MKKLTAITLALCLCVCLAFTACGGKSSSTPAADKDYAAIIEAAREKDFNDAFPIITGKKGEDATLATNPNNISDSDAAAMIEMALDFYTLDSNTLCENYALSLSLMNVNSYVVGIFMPADGEKGALLEKAEEFKQNQIQAQQFYLPDQLEIAQNAVVKEVPSGEIIIVMCEGSDKVAQSIEDALKA